MVRHDKNYNELKNKGNIFDLVVNQIGMAWLQFILVRTKPSSPTFES